MGSKGRLPPYRNPVPGPEFLLPPEQFGFGVHPPPGPLPFEMLPPPEILEQRLAVQHAEMQKLLLENHRLADTHGSLRHDLVGAQQELQRLQANMEAARANNEKNMAALKEKIMKMENDLKGSDKVKKELQQAHMEAQNLVASRQELFAKVQKLSQDLQRAHGDAQHIPAVIAELEAARREYQHFRATYDYERKRRIDHHDSIQGMEKNYVTMVREVEKLRAELSNAGDVYRTGPQNESDPNVSSGHFHGGQDTYDVYGNYQARLPSAGAAAPRPSAMLPGHDQARGATYDISKTSSYDTSRVPPTGSARDAPKATEPVTQPGAVGTNNPTHYSFSAAPHSYRSAPVASAYAPSIAYGSGQVTPTYTLDSAAYITPHGQSTYGAPTYGMTQQPATYNLGGQNAGGSVSGYDLLGANVARRP